MSNFDAWGSCDLQCCITGCSVHSGVVCLVKAPGNLQYHTPSTFWRLLGMTFSCMIAGHSVCNCSIESYVGFIYRDLNNFQDIQLAFHQANCYHSDLTVVLQELSAATRGWKHLLGLLWFLRLSGSLEILITNQKWKPSSTVWPQPMVPCSGRQKITPKRSPCDATREDGWDAAASMASLLLHDAGSRLGSSLGSRLGSRLVAEVVVAASIKPRATPAMG